VRKVKLDMGGKAGLVTGAAGGIGRAIAGALVESGAGVLLVDRDELALEQAARELRAEAYAADLARDDAPESAVERAVAEWGRIDFLVNAAGVQARGPVTELSDEDWERLHAVNLRSVFRASRAAARQMKEGGNGAMLNVASISSTVGVPGIVAYGAMKGGVVQLTKGFAVELAPYGVRVNAVAPGYVSTAMTEELWSDEARRAETTARIPLGRFASPDEISPAALFLLSPAAGYVTGEVLHVDGGYVAK
jgi:NAD(P)-dependent dehydrogenase (short-subunit alcohol dehydrogenase family)